MTSTGETSFERPGSVDLIKMHTIGRSVGWFAAAYCACSMSGAPIAVAGSVDEGQIGTADPILVEAVAPDGRWTLVCQDRSVAREDDPVLVGRHGEIVGAELRPYLVVKDGPGTRIDEFVAADASGKFVAVIQQGDLTIIDTKTSKTTRLPGADTRTADRRFGNHRVASFDRDGKHVLYLRTRGSGNRVVLRSL